MTAEPAEPGPSNDDLMKELREIKDRIKEFNTIKREVKDLSEKLESASEIIHHQQLFCESIDNKERRCNLIISGLPEEADDIGSNDDEKIKSVLEKAKCPESIDPSSFVLRRLGQPNPSFTRGRFLHVTVPTPQIRDSIIAASKELRNADEPYTRVYINKDIHPVVRKEIGRLKKKVKDEKAIPENQGVEIVYDAKKRTVTRNGTIIDRFSPKFF